MTVCLFPKTLTVARRSFSLVKGVYTEGATVTVTFKGNVQPLSNRDVVGLNVGRHDVGKVRIFSDTRLVETKTPSTPSTDETCGDIITFAGQEYEVIQENVHDNGLLPHYLYIAELRGQAPE